MNDSLASVDISSLFQTVEEIVAPEEVGVNGTIPEWLRGKLFHVGPGKLDLSKCTLRDWLDGYGMVTKFDIQDGPRVSLQSKYVKTEAFEKSVAAGRPVFTEYGTPAMVEGSKSLLSKIVSTLTRDDMSDNCSASMYTVQNHLCASAATCYLSEIDPETLETKGRLDAKKLLGQNGYGVHPLVDEEGNMWNMGFTVMPTLKYNLVKIPCGLKGQDLSKVMGSGKTVTSISSRWSGALAFNHSFGMTEKHVVFIEQPYVVKVSRVLAAKVKEYSVKEWLDWQPTEKNRFYLIEKSSGKVVNLEILSKDPFFFMHIVNCFQDGNQVVVDVTTSRDPSVTDATSLAKLRQNILEPVEPIRLQRFVIPLPQSENIKDFPEAANLLERLSQGSTASAVRVGNTLVVSPDDITDSGIDRTTIHPGLVGKKYKFLYGTGSFIFSNVRKAKEPSDGIFGVNKLNLETKKVETLRLPKGLFPGEPVFVPRRRGGSEEEEDEGVVLVPVESALEGAKNFLWIVDAKSWKELGRAEFASRIPGMMHSVFVPEC